MVYTAQPLPGYRCLVNLAGATTPGADVVLTDLGDHATFTVPLADSHRYLDRAIAPVVQTQCDEIQTVALTGAPTGGTFTLTLGGNTTSGIAWNASAATVQAALVALASIGAGNVTVSGSAGGPWTVAFVGALTLTAESLFTKNNAGLTGGSSPDVSIARAQAGHTWATISAGTYTVRSLTAQIVLNTPFVGSTVGVRLHTFNYLPYAAITYAWDITSTLTNPMLDITAFQGAAGAGMISVIPGSLTSGSFACKAWQVTPGSWVYLQHLLSDDLLILSFVDPNGTNAFEAYCRIASSTLISSLTTVAEEDLMFTIDAQPVLI